MEEEAGAEEEEEDGERGEREMPFLGEGDDLLVVSGGGEGGAGEEGGERTMGFPPRTHSGSMAVYVDVWTVVDKDENKNKKTRQA